MLHFYTTLNRRKIVVFLVFMLIVVGVYHSVFKRLPEGVSMEGDTFLVLNEDVVFLTDETYIDSNGDRQVEQNIFDEVFCMIDKAEKYILIDMFLYNDFQVAEREKTRGLSGELTEALIAKKKEMPDISITVISDPINTVYGGQESKHFKKLEDAGITVVLTNLDPLRDGNPIYSSFWRMFFQWFDNSDKGGFLVHPFQHDGYLVTARSYLSMLNFKANHRKLIVADDGKNGLQTLVMSANPHDGSSAHSNSALVVKSGIWKDVIESERAVGVFSNKEIISYDGSVEEETGNVIAQLLTESKIKEKLIKSINNLKKGDELDMAVFYLSDRNVIKALKEADIRGVIMRIILDPNKDAFGYEKNGVPNRPVAHELLSHSDGNTQLRWCDTHGEQCHTKLTLFRSGDTKSLLLGSANLTRKNLDDYNLETNIFIEGQKVNAIIDAEKYFERIWNNENGKQYTVLYGEYAESSFYKMILYRFMEKFGTSTF